MTLDRFSEIAGVPLHYDRFSSAQYGTIGTPFSPLIDIGFAKELSACFKELKKKFKPKVGELEVITSGGVGRSGSGASMHHQNKAFDLDGLFFADAQIIANEFPEERHFYLAIECILRRHFGVVLAYDYNRAHEDHFHIDNSRSVGFRKDARSHTIFVQNLLTYVYDLPVARDGLWGGETEHAVKELQSRDEIGSLFRKDEWLTFCDKSATLALERIGAPPPRRHFV